MHRVFVSQELQSCQETKISSENLRKPKLGDEAAVCMVFESVPSALKHRDLSPVFGPDQFLCRVLLTEAQLPHLYCLVGWLCG